MLCSCPLGGSATDAEVLAEAAEDLEIEAEGFGEFEPVASNGTEAEDDPEGRAENRRVEIHYDG